MSSTARTAARQPIRLGVITDQTGPLSFLGVANANVARLVIDDINDRGGLLERPVELVLEDSATDDAVAEARARKLVETDQVDVVFGGIYSSTRQAIKRPVVEQAGKLYFYPEQYEGQESHPLIFCTGPVPAQQVDPLIPWLMRETGARKFYLPSADYIWPHVMNGRVRRAVAAGGGSVVGEEYFPMDQLDYAPVVERIMASGAEVVFNTIVPPGLVPFLQQLHDAGFTKRGGRVVCTYFEENLLRLLPGPLVEGIYSCLDYYVQVDDPFSVALRKRYDARFPGSALLTAGSAATGMYRALKLWEAAVRKAGTIEQAAVIAALDSASLAEGPGGPATMMPGQHHLRLNMYIAQARGGEFVVLKDLGPINPDEPIVAAR